MNNVTPKQVSAAYACIAQSEREEFEEARRAREERQQRAAKERKAAQRARAAALDSVVREDHLDLERRSLAGVLAWACGTPESHPVDAILQEVSHRLGILERGWNAEDADEQPVMTAKMVGLELNMLQRRVDAVRELLEHAGAPHRRAMFTEQAGGTVDAAAEE